MLGITCGGPFCLLFTQKYRQLHWRHSARRRGGERGKDVGWEKTEKVKGPHLILLLLLMCMVLLNECCNVCDATERCQIFVRIASCRSGCLAQSLRRRVHLC